ncbi:hypothetical protein [Streptomyces sp. NPDC048002]|uniref:hypothetical protein n=1 Tax=Streptomyces sp. NPDC048002 TaxID=3154344 RepID=UPI0033D790C4
MRRTPRYPKLRLCLVMAATAAFTAGCAEGDGDGGDRGGADRQPRPPALTWQQELRTSDALQHLTAECMRRQGFSYWEDRTLTLQESRPVRYVQDDVAWARTHGYGGRIDVKSQQAREDNPLGAYRRSLSASRRAAFDTALDGGGDARVLTAPLPGGGEIRKRSGGCMEEAERELYGDPAEWFRTGKIAAGLNALYGADLMADPQLTDRLRAWARCMEKAGHSYADPQAARDSVRVDTSRLGAARADEAFAAERRTAVADATCARETSLKTVASARETYYRDRLRDRFGKDLDAYRGLSRQAYDRAVRIVAQRD